MRTRFSIGTLLVFVLIVTGAITSFAQISNSTDSINDLATHKFHPKNPTVVFGSSLAAASTTIQPSAIAEMQALAREKRSRTATQRKINPNVLFTSRMMQGQAAAPGVPNLETGVDLDTNENLVLDISAYVSDGLLDRIRHQGVTVLGSWPEYNTLRASVPASKVETIAAFSEVIFVSTKQEATTWRAVKPTSGKSDRVKSYLSGLLSTNSTAIGSVTSEGDKAHKADVARATYGVSGTGLKIGVLSDGVSNLSASQALGDLGTVTVIPGQGGDGDEGTAMLEIIHDLAPSAKLYFATAWPTSAQFASNIKALRAAGCDIIVDDVSYYVETRFQDGQAASIVSPTNQGVVVQAVNDVVADGAFYFSSAANSGNLDDKTSGTWEGDFADGGFIPDVGNVHTYGASTFNVITGTTGALILTWSDPIGASVNDYDLYVLDSTAAHVALASTYTQDASGPADPVEWLYTSVPANYIILIAKYDGAARYLHLSTNRGAIEFNTPGASYGHNASKQAYGVAATPAFWSFGPSPTWPTGPFPGAFSATNHVELFTSDGPRRIFYNGDGTPLTAGNFSATGGTALNKPDFTAADGVSVSGIGGFGAPFYGTSAAAPHAAAIAALIKSARPTITAAQMKTALNASAIDIQGTGWDRNSGTGIIMADTAVASLGTNANANPDIGSVVATENPGNHNGYIEPGEGVSLVVSLHNKLGAAAATAIKATLSTTTPGVTITEPHGSTTYPNLAAAAAAVNGTAPFIFTLASDFPPCATSIDFDLSLEYTGGPSPRVIPISVPVGPPPVYVTHNLGGTPATITGVATATGNQDGRISRSGIPVTCGATPKLFTGTIGAGTMRAFDSYTFTACRNTCAAFEINDPQNATLLFTSLYTPGFDGANIATNYIGDSGASYSTQSYSAQLTQGSAYTVVVNEVNPGTGAGKGYTLALPGCALNCGVLNHPPLAVVHDVTVDANAFKVANANINNGSSDPDGDALTITATPAGPYSIGTREVMLTVVDTKGATAQAKANVTVNPIPTSTVVALTNPSSGNPPFGPMTVTATVAANFNADYTGTVTFKMDGTTTSSAVAIDAHKTASWTLTPAVGAHSFIATYSGDVSYATSISTAAPITVVAGPSKVTLSTSKASANFGQSVTFSATVASITGGPAATGNVAFSEGETVLGTSAVNANGVATYSTSALALGNHSITAAYDGDANYPAATAAAITQAVIAPDFTISASPTSFTIASGNTGTTTITVTPLGTFSGTVTLTCGALPQHATCSFSPATVSPTTTAVTSVLTVNTKSATTASAFGLNTAVFAMLSFALPGILIIPVRRKKAAKYLLLSLLLVLTITMVIGLAGCGDSNKQPAPVVPTTTPAGTYTVPVTISGGSQSHAMNLSITVQ
jgi:hypothetical protein